MFSGMVLIKSRSVMKPNEWVHIEASTIAKLGQLVVKVRTPDTIIADIVKSLVWVLRG